MADVKLTIDGKDISVPAGTTLLEAARENGIFIPTLCYDERLSLWGGCRLCVVEIEGRRGLAASCITEAAEGMNVFTSSPAVIEARKTVLELLLANHPQDCLTCSKNASCRLQDYAYMYGVKEDTFKGEKHAYPVEKDNPFIVRDMNKCILCGKCIRACSEVQVNNVIDFAYRGFNTRVTPALDRSYLESGKCVFCGNCIQVCPVGALTEKASLGQGREWELKKVRTTCTFCGVGCNLEVNVKDDKVVRVKGWDGAAVNDGWLCVKGRFGNDFIDSPERIKRPLIREGVRGEGRFLEASWEEALEYTARRLKEIKEKHGSQAIAAFSSARCTNEENFLMQKFMRAVIGTNNVDHCART